MSHCGPFVLGVDGGGTHTRCLVVGLDGAVLGQGDAGPSNYLRVGAEAAVASVREAVACAVEMAGAELPAKAAAICLAGVGRPANRAEMLGRLAGLAERLLLETDAAAALAGAHALGPGIVVSAGTGAIAYGQDEAGRLVRCDGWGPLLGDEGSGYWIGAEVLRAVTRSADGRDGPTALTAAVLGHLGLAAPADLVDRFTWGQYGAAEVAELARLCSEVGAEGDEAAVAILRRAGAQLAEACVTAAGKIGGLQDGLRIAVAGSVMGDGIVLEAFRDAVRAALPEATIAAALFSPVEGAVLLALRHAGVQACRVVRGA